MLPGQGVGLNFHLQAKDFQANGVSGRGLRQRRRYLQSNAFVHFHDIECSGNPQRRAAGADSTSKDGRRVGGHRAYGEEIGGSLEHGEISRICTLFGTCQSIHRQHRRYARRRQPDP